MAEKTFNTRIKHKKDTEANWEANNPVLLDGEFAIVVTADGENKIKIGDGSTAYNLLPFSSSNSNWNDLEEKPENFVFFSDEIDTIDIQNEYHHVCNPNLLDNWYFGNPVNQRGQESYLNESNSNLYTIDRWIVTGASYDVAERKLTTLAYRGRLTQKVNNKNIIGKEVTFSALIDSCESVKVWLRVEDSNNGEYVKVGGAIGQSGLFTTTFIVKDFGSYASIGVELEAQDGYAVINSIKLELGDTQTLAHQDSTGTWVLNEIPDYTEQLLRCLRYCFVASTGNHLVGMALSVSTTDAYATINLPVPMRTTPTINADASFTLRGNGTESAVGSRSVSNIFGSSLTLWVASTNLTSYIMYGLRANEKLIFSADL